MFGIQYCMTMFQFMKTNSMLFNIFHRNTRFRLLHSLSLVLLFKSFSVQGHQVLLKAKSEDMGSTGITGLMDNSRTSIHSSQITEVHNVPMRVITRPIPPVLDEEKVLSLMETIQVRQLCLNFVNISCNSS